MHNIEKDLEQFELIVEGGKLDGCLVYHEEVKDFIVGLVEEFLCGLDELSEKLNEKLSE